MDSRFTALAVLLIDDDPQQAAATRDVLKELDCDPVALATNLRDATRMAATLSPDLFIVDARLPGPLDGIALGKRLWLQHRAPVIFLVEQADAGAVRQAMKVEGATSLVRPYDRTALALAIAQALNLSPSVRA